MRLAEIAETLGCALRRLYDEHGPDCGGATYGELHRLYGGPRPMQAANAWFWLFARVQIAAGLGDLEVATVNGGKVLRVRAGRAS